MIEVGKEEAEEIATRHAAGTRYKYGEYEGSVKEVRFGEHRSAFKLETIRICENGDPEPRSFRASFGIAIDDLREWCAERYACPKESIVLWFEP